MGQEPVAEYPVLASGRKVLPVAAVQVLVPSAFVAFTFVAPGFVSESFATAMRWSSCTVLVLLAVGVAGPLIVRTVRRRPWIVMDGGGVRFPQFRVEVPWHDVREVEVVERGKHRIVVFHVADVAAVMAALTPFRRWTVRNSVRFFGTPLTIADVLTVPSGRQMAEIAEGFRRAPVREARTPDGFVVDEIRSPPFLGEP